MTKTIKKRSVRFVSIPLERAKEFINFKPVRLFFVVAILFILSLSIVTIGVSAYYIKVENLQFVEKIQKSKILLDNLNFEYKKLSSELSELYFYETGK